MLDWQSNLIMYRVRRVIDLTWLRVLSRETDTELRPAKASDITWFRASKSCSSLSSFFPLHPLAISNRQHRDSRLTLLLHRIMLPSNRFILCWVLRSLDTESFSPSYGSVPIILHHKLDSGQRRDPTVAYCSQQRVIRTIGCLRIVLWEFDCQHSTDSSKSIQVDLFQHRVPRSADSQSHQVHHIHLFLSCSASSSHLYTASMETPGRFQSVSAYVRCLVWLYCVFVLLFENSISSSINYNQGSSKLIYSIIVFILDHSSFVQGH